MLGQRDELRALLGGPLDEARGLAKISLDVGP
jgi:hypothetical protein